MYKINEAFSILRNKEKRNECDEKLRKISSFQVVRENETSSDFSQSPSIYTSHNYDYYNEEDYDEFNQEEFIEWISHFQESYMRYVYNFYKESHEIEDKFIMNLFEQFENIKYDEMRLFKKKKKNISI